MIDSWISVTGHLTTYQVVSDELEAFTMPVVGESTYKPPLLFANPHWQTAVPTLFRKVTGIQYRRQRIDTSDGDFLDLDWSRVQETALGIVLHGLEGDSTRGYVMGMVKALNRSGWDALALNFRGCSGEPNRLLRMYHSGDIADLDAVIATVTKDSIYDTIALIGFSLGGNVILKYLGERDRDLDPSIKAAVTLSVPCDLKACSQRLEEFRNRLYLKRFLRLLHAKIQHKAHCFPDSISADDYTSIRTLKEFDDRYTAPIHGFSSADDYYARASSKQFLSSIATPTLLINAADDPFLSDSCYPMQEAESNPNLFLEIPRHGGHCGFMSGRLHDEYWSETRTLSFLERYR
jgi:hypothetical protein